MTSMASESPPDVNLFGEAGSQPSAEPKPYRVLARKYRPQNFADLIGQDAMVQTLGNAIRRDRLAHAFLLTGVRGVGKTSTARLIAKALNCIGPDGTGGPTIDPCGVCEPCVAIADGRHIDVVEMDAASHTGVDDVREIIEAVRYAAVSARYKVYIIDEVHMLSKNAFNALLKTLEEPPPHVKFLFATTEVNKVPVTVLSRCQRFDLRRIPADVLASHFARVAGKEQVEIEPEALALIARAAEGSARDGLSILDQAIAHGLGKVEAAEVRTMLGLSDRGAIRTLFGTLLAGDAQAALSALGEQYALGVEPSALIRGLLECVHGVTRAKVGKVDDPAQSAEEREAYADWASRLSYAVIHRLWQLLLKGLGEVHEAPMPLEAAEMALLRIIHASELPDPGQLMERLMNGEALPAAPGSPAGSGAGQGEMLRTPGNFRALITLLEDRGKRLLAQQLHDNVGLLRYEPPELEFRQKASLPKDFARELSGALKEVSGTSWKVRIIEGQEAPSMRDHEKADEEAARQAVLDSPLVKAAFEAFPDAELIGYTLDEQRSA
jgi:DNA polymerase-3 subunit gamma/tau